MPIYMDVHHVPGIEARDAAEAHRKDMLIQESFNCKCMTYWIDEIRGVAFCLIESPNKLAVEEMHRKSHGLIPSKIIEVKNEVVESFLGRINDPEGVEISDDGLKVFSESAMRILLVTDIIDPILLRIRLGRDKANELINRQNSIIRKELSIHQGREVEYGGKGFIASFSTAGKAISCALSILKNLPTDNRKVTQFKIGVNAGEPVSKSNTLFGDAIQLARNLCTTSNNDQIVITSMVKELMAKDYSATGQDNFITLMPQDETFVESLFNKLEENWQDPNFAVTEICQAMSMSKSQLYRKTVALWGLPPNVLLKEFRLEKARELLKSQAVNISETTFDSGFNSPSYFTKCFKKKYGLAPALYLNSRQ
jgi:AraC-like DNA-binding protein